MKKKIDMIKSKPFVNSVILELMFSYFHQNFFLNKTVTFIIIYGSKLAILWQFHQHKY